MMWTEIGVWALGFGAVWFSGFLVGKAHTRAQHVAQLLRITEQNAKVLTHGRFGQGSSLSPRTEERHHVR